MAVVLISNPGTEGPRLVRRSGHDGAFTGVTPAAHDDWLADQLGAPQQLHGRDELVEVDVQHPG